MTDNTARGLKGRFVGNKKRRIRGKNGQFCKTDQVSDTAKHDQHEEEPAWIELRVYFQLTDVG